MGASDRLRTRGARRARSILATLSDELRAARLEAGISQGEAGRRAGLSADKVWKIEHQRLATLSFDDACRLAAILGLDLSARLYPSGVRVRDAGQSSRLTRLLINVAAPLRFRIDVALPSRADAPELRAWDALITGYGERTGLELESRLTDVQATIRRHSLKRRDDPVDHFLMVIADTKHNRHVMREFAPLLTELPHLRTSNVMAELRSGRHPPTGWMLF